MKRKNNLQLRIIAIHFFILFAGLAPLINTWSVEDTYANERRERCLEVLHEAMVSDENFWMNVHAAEALIYNVYTDGVEEYFLKLQNDPRSNIIGISRVLARLNKKDAVQYQKYIHQIRDVFLNSDSVNQRITALESLGKLGYSEPLPEILRLADEGESSMKTFSRWILANSGDAKDEARLAELLNSKEPKEYFYAAYALRFMDGVNPETYASLKACASRLTKDAPYRVYVLSTLFVHSPPENKNKVKEDLLTYIQGEKSERYEVGQALAISGTVSDIQILEQLLDDSDMDVQVSAANALLRVERRTHRGLSWPDWVVIVIYVGLMLGIGWYFSKRQKTSEDYLVGGRQMNSFISGISLFASFFSTISFLALAGEVIKHGPLVIIVMIASFPVIYLVTAYLIIPFFMKLPITSAYQILEKPLGRGVRMAGSVIFLLTRFVWMALLIFLTSKALVVMFGWDNKYILYISLLTGLITIIYATMGGLRAVVTTDVIQFFILLFGAVITIVLVTINMRGIENWVPTEWAPNWDNLVLFSWSPYIRLTIVFTFIHAISWWVCTAGSDQMAIQRFIATRDIKTARRTFLTSQIGEKILFFILMCVGFSLLGFYRTNPFFIPDGKDLITDADFLFPHYIANHLPIGLAGIVIAALFSAAMSSLSSGLNSTAAVITTDIIPWLGKSMQNINPLKLARWSSLLIGILVLGVSTTMRYVPGNIMEVTAKTNGVFVAPLFNLFFMAMFIPYATPFGTIMGSIYGIAIGVLIAFWDVLTGQPGITFLWIIPASLVISIGASMLFSLIPLKGKGWKATLIWSFMLMLPIALVYLFIMI
ncbi:MAG: sodium/solute symporter [Bacteroidales bacterium]|nr:sodium/solute symporter [Bacteroidales bacterium]